MILGFHGATTMTSDLATDIAVSAQVGFKGLEIWATKADHYLTAGKLDELRSLFEGRNPPPCWLWAYQGKIK